jgi:hypothetical protein
MTKHAEESLHNTLAVQQESLAVKATSGAPAEWIKIRPENAMKIKLLQAYKQNGFVLKNVPKHV